MLYTVVALHSNRFMNETVAKQRNISRQKLILHYESGLVA
jgi:hypothetical protein